MAKHWFTFESSKGEHAVFSESRQDAERQMREVRRSKDKMLLDWSDSLDKETR